MTTNHFGEQCPYTKQDTLPCIEGYCNECEMYKKYIEWCESLWEPPSFKG